MSTGGTRYGIRDTRHEMHVTPEGEFNTNLIYDEALV
jgi:hypothetical protein